MVKKFTKILETEIWVLYIEAIPEIAGDMVYCRYCGDSIDEYSITFTIGFLGKEAKVCTKCAIKYSAI